MKARSMFAGLLLLYGAPTSEPLLACGDKFLVVGRGTRFQRASVPRAPAAILIYANPASNLPSALDNVPVETTLRKAGYRPTSVVTSDELEMALRQGGWDLILVDVNEDETVSRRVRGDNAPVVLPVVYNPTNAQWKQAKQQYPSVLRSPTKTQVFLDTIDEALSSRSASAKPPAKTAS